MWLTSFQQVPLGGGTQLHQWLQLVHGVGHVVQITEKHQHKQALLVEAQEIAVS